MFSLECSVGEIQACNPALCSLPAQVREEEIRISYMEGVPPNGLLEAPKATHGRGSWLFFPYTRVYEIMHTIFTYGEMQVSLMACLPTNHGSKVIFLQSLYMHILKNGFLTPKASRQLQ